MSTPLVRILVSIGASFSAGVLGSLATMPKIPTWYAELAKPVLNPPNFVFGPVWSVLYVLMGIALYLYWQRVPTGQRVGFWLFGIQIALNLAWSLVFFGGESLWGGLVVILLLWLAIIGTIVVFWRVSRLAAWLMVPYLIWVIFATYLNAGIAVLN